MTAKLPPRIKPMLATLADAPFSNKDWLYEIKWDGYRAVASIQKGHVDLYSRNFSDFSKQYISVVAKLEKIKDDVILDGEIVAYDKDGNVGFQALQNHGKSPSNINYMVFDILRLNGKDLTSFPLIERKKLLAKFAEKYPQISLSDYILEDGEAFFKKAVEKNLEGIMAKKLDSPYVAGGRTDYWLKIKHHQTEEAIICGFTEPKGSRNHFGSLVLGTYKDKKLVFIGHTGTGFTEKTLKELSAKMKPLITSKSPFLAKVPLNAPITWLKPKLIAQLKFAEWTGEGIMRQSVFLGLREDKEPKSVHKEKKVNIKTIMKNKKETKTEDKNSNADFTNTDKVYFPKLGLTKGDVIDYYDKISPVLLPYLKDRPQSLNRHPSGVSKSNFFQKNITSALPSFAETVKIHSDSNDEDINYLVCQNKETLLYMANLGCIEINPWNSRKEKLDYPDYMIFDLDPGDNTWAELVKVAKMVKEVLDDSCQKSYLKTSGKSGLHICVPLGAKYHFADVRKFSELISQIVHERLPDITSLERSPAKRTKRIYLDFLQNRIGQTTASVYSLRPTEDAMVSTPLKWTELTLKLDPKKFNIKTIHSRLKKVGDLWQPIIKESVNLKKSIICLEKTLAKKK